MKTIFATLALALAAAAPATAMTTNGAAQTKIERYAPDVDVDALSNPQIASILNVIDSGDSHSDRRALVRSLVRQYQ
ncbi:hypothetical protein OCH239_21300 [Roseivivax halodurans JCM 10272]|uniref:Uncharacterized protein n=1 Tax=Roseivivax halodurans JCM 10272 TaxID=1449350 RepID=X7EGD3_9RHOB|nr:hypothetical protein [Roseivivax halodurans]ETX14900.1 hypothetical protein OCH239_21300 [Roseivivax halodurans JCM 10272]